MTAPRRPVITQGLDSSRPCVICMKSSESIGKRAPADLKKAYYRLAQEVPPGSQSRTTRSPRTSSRRRRTPTRSCPTTISARATTASASTGIRGAGGGGGGAGFSNVEDIFSAFGDLFGDFFGGRASGRRAAAARRRSPRRSRADVRRGGVGHDQGGQGHARRSRCATCNATGAKPGQQARDLRDLQGQGPGRPRAGLLHGADHVSALPRRGQDDQGPVRGLPRSRHQARDLDAAGHRARRASTTARRCGSRARARPPRAASTGHLYVVLHVQGDERFRREGDDILTEMPVSFVKAALGGEIEVHTLEDNCTRHRDGRARAGHAAGRRDGPPRPGHPARRRAAAAAIR